MHMCLSLVCLGQMRLKIERDKKVERNKGPREERDKCLEREKEIMCALRRECVTGHSCCVSNSLDTRGESGVLVIASRL